MLDETAKLTAESIERARALLERDTPPSPYIILLSPRQIRGIHKRSDKHYIDFYEKDGELWALYTYWGHYNAQVYKPYSMYGYNAAYTWDEYLKIIGENKNAEN